jgi:hypothetical protein
LHPDDNDNLNPTSTVVKLEERKKQPPALLTEDEVVGWFAEAIRARPIPTAGMVEPIANAVNLIVIWKRHFWRQPDDEFVEDLLGPQRRVKKAVPHLVKALRLLREATNAGVFAPSPLGGVRDTSTEEAAISAIEELLRKYPARSPGERGAGSSYLPYARGDWTPLVYSALEKAGWASPGITDNSPVPHVLSKMIERAFGSPIPPSTVARHLRSAANSKNGGGNKSEG